MSCCDAYEAINTGTTIATELFNVKVILPHYRSGQAHRASGDRGYQNLQTVDT